MNSCSRLVAVLSTCVLCIIGSGCGAGQLFAPLMGRTPHATGTWIGRIVSITVHDYEGEEYEAAGLVIESGPRTLRPSGGGGGLPYTLRDDDVPFLSDVGVRIMDPNELGVPLRSRVRVKGDMLSAGVGVNVPAVRGGTAFRFVYRKAGEPSGARLIIRMDGKPKVLTE